MQDDWLSIGRRQEGTDARDAAAYRQGGQWQDGLHSVTAGWPSLRYGKEAGGRVAFGRAEVESIAILTLPQASLRK
jgi:hypothetical protein